MHWLLLFLSFSSFAQTSINIDADKAVHTTSESYLSFAIDTAQIVGSYWWDKSGEMEQGKGKYKTTPLDLTNPKLIALARALSPAILRIGGSEADFVYYDVAGKLTTPPKGYESLLTKNQWDLINSFVKKSNNELFFTLNIGAGTWDQDDNWDASNAIDLITYSKEKKYPIKYWELGNEPFAFWIIFGLFQQPSESWYTKTYVKAKSLIKNINPSGLLAGPASAFWPIIGEPFGFLFGKTKNFVQQIKDNLDILTWHYYPTQSQRCPVAVRRASLDRFLNPETLDEIKDWAQENQLLRNQHSPNAKLWLGETGPAQCGGQKDLSDRFVSSFWWLDQLGTLAQFQHDVVIRQTLIDSDYGMIDLADYSPRPDYWASLFWKLSMGQKVLKNNYSNRGKKLRIYTHCTSKKHPYYRPGAVTFLVINMDKKEQELVTPFKAPYRKYELYAQSLDAKEVILNGIELKMVGNHFPHFPPITSRLASIKIPGHSYGFYVFDNANVAACQI